MTNRLLVVLLLVLCLRVEPECELWQSTKRFVSRRPAADLFRKVLAEIMSQTRVPILLPSELPAPTREKEVHLVFGKGQTNKYEISLYYEGPGVNANFVAYFAGEASRKQFEVGKKVTLAKGSPATLARSNAVVLVLHLGSNGAKMVSCTPYS